MIASRIAAWTWFTSDWFAETSRIEYSSFDQVDVELRQARIDRALDSSGHRPNDIEYVIYRWISILGE